MGAGGFHVRVRDGIGCRHPAKATRSSNPPARHYWVMAGVAGFGAVCVVECVGGVADCYAW